MPGYARGVFVLAVVLLVSGLAFAHDPGSLGEGTNRPQPSQRILVTHEGGGAFAVALLAASVLAAAAFVSLSWPRPGLPHAAGGGHGPSAA
jgi:hypothetical protein